MTRSVLLLRGINVGKAHRIAMADLRALLEAEGHADVRTLLQSGNVVLGAQLPAEELAASVEQALERRFGFLVPTVVRTADQLLAAVARDPLGSVATDRHRTELEDRAEDRRTAAALSWTVCAGCQFARSGPGTPRTPMPVEGAAQPAAIAAVSRSRVSSTCHSRAPPARSASATAPASAG
jgi:hypothetical protein